MSHFCLQRRAVSVCLIVYLCKTICWCLGHLAADMMHVHPVCLWEMGDGKWAMMPPRLLGTRKQGRLWAPWYSVLDLEICHRSAPKVSPMSPYEAHWKRIR